MRRRMWAVLLLAPVLLSGCGVLRGASASGGGTAGAAGAPSAGPGWVVVSRGSATPSSRPSYPATSPTPVASGFLPLGPPTPTRTPVSTCSPNLFDFSKIGPAGLDRKTGYVFSVDAVVHRRSGDGTHAATVARSKVIYTT